MKSKEAHNKHQYFSALTLDEFGSSILNALNAHVAVVDQKGMVVAFNRQWENCAGLIENKWYRPGLNENILQILQAPLARGSDFSLRFLLGLKSVLANERDTFELNYTVTVDGQKKWFKATTNRLQGDGGAVLIHEDVTANVEGKKAEKESQLKFKKHFENSLYGILIADDNNVILEANSAACKLLNATSEDIIMEQVDNFIPVDMDVHGIQKLINKQGNYLGESHIHTLDGKQLPVELSVTLFRNENGVPVTSWAFKNISDRKEAEKAIRQSEQKYRMHFENAHEGILLTCPEGKVLEANPSACKILGYTKEELANSHRSLVFDETIPANEMALKKRRSEGTFTGKLVLTHKEGHQLTVKLSSVIYKTGSGEERSIVTFTDISESIAFQKELERTKKLNDIAVEAANIGLWELNMITGQAYYNEMWYKMLGFECDDVEFTRDFFYELIHPEDEQIPGKELERYLNEPDKEYEAEFRLKNKEDGYRWILAKARFTKWNHEGEPVKLVGCHIDITEHKKRQEQITEANQKLEQAQQIAKLGYWTHNFKEDVSDWSQEMYNIWEVEPDTFKPNLENFFSTIHSEDLHLFRNDMDAAFPDQNFYDLEHRIVTPGGKVKWILERIALQKDEAGRPFIMEGTAQDITDRKTAEEENKKHQKMFSQLFHNSPIGIVHIDNEGNVIDTNTSFEQIFGFSKNEIKNTKLDEVIVPEKLGKQAKTLSKFSFMGESFQTETIRIRKDGTEIPVMIGSVPVEMNGEVISTYGMYMDITERKNLEDQILDLLKTEKKARLKMEEMFEESPSAITLLEGEDLKYTFSNKQNYKLVGKTDLIGKRIADVFPEYEEQGIMALLREAYESGRSMQFNEKEIYFRREGGKKRLYLNCAVKPLFNKKKQVYGIFLEAIDVTERVESRKLIEKSLKEKETLLQEVHHRVKNNLAIISGLLELEIMGCEKSELSQRMSTTQSRIITIAKIHELLYKNDSLSHIKFNNYIESVVKPEGNAPTKLAKNLFSRFHLEEVELNVNQAIPAGVFLNELLSRFNASFNDESSSFNIEFYLHEKDDHVFIEILDRSKKLLKTLQEKFNKKEGLSDELLEVLLAQIHGEMNFSFKDEHKVFIRFPKRETKGPHSALL